MSELIEQIMAEKSQLEDHMKYGELHQYIDDNAEDLYRLLERAIKLLNEERKREAA